jgi:Spy/CpxP family protein refolding chaperone
MKKIFLSLIVLLVPVILLSQGISKPPMVQPPPLVEDEDIAPPPPPEERENARIFLAYKMKERLKLTEEQTIKVLEILKEGDEFRMKHKEKMAELRRKCYDLLKNEKANDAELKRMVEEMKKMRVEGEAKMDETESKLLSILTPRQQLEWMLFKKELQKGERRGERNCPPQPPPQGKRGRN